MTSHASDDEDEEKSENNMKLRAFQLPLAQRYLVG
jgi:hypothetical protein